MHIYKNKTHASSRKHACSRAIIFGIQIMVALLQECFLPATLLNKEEVRADLAYQEV